MNSSIFSILSIIRRNGFAVLMLMLLIFGSVGRSFGQAPVAQFNTNPGYSSNGDLSVCAGSTILFTLAANNVTFINSNTTVSWTFVNGSITSSNLRTPFPVSFSISGSATLTLTTGSLVSTKTIQIIVSSAPPYTPDLVLSSSSLLSSWTSSIENGIKTFKVCPGNSTPQNLGLDVTPAINCSSVTAPDAFGYGPGTLTSFDQLQWTNCSGTYNYFDNLYSQGFYYLVFNINFNASFSSKVPHI
jgi:hypothetical protein